MCKGLKNIFCGNQKTPADYIYEWAKALDAEVKRLSDDVTVLTTLVTGEPIDLETLLASKADAVHTHEMEDINLLSDEFEKKVDKPALIPAATLKGYLVEFGEDKTIKSAGKKVNELAEAVHTHTINDIDTLTQELNKSTDINPFVLYTTDHWEILGVSEEEDCIQSIENLISRAVGDSSSLAIDVQFNIGVTYDYHTMEDGHYDMKYVAHIWSSYAGTNTYDFNLEIYNGSSVECTTVRGVGKTAGELDYSNAVFEESWRFVNTSTVEDAWKHLAPRQLKIDNEQGLTTLFASSIAELWLNCTQDTEYPVMVELWNDRHGTDKTKILGKVVTHGYGNSVPYLEIYFTTYRILLEGSGDYTAAQLRSGYIAPADTSWDIYLTDYSNLNLFVAQ